MHHVYFNENDNRYSASYQRGKQKIANCSSGTMPFEQAFVLARFYYDFQDTNAIIAEAEAMAADELD